MRESLLDSVRLLAHPKTVKEVASVSPIKRKLIEDDIALTSLQKPKTVTASVWLGQRNLWNDFKTGNHGARGENGHCRNSQFAKCPNDGVAPSRAAESPLIPSSFVLRPSASTTSSRTRYVICRHHHHSKSFSKELECMFPLWQQAKQRLEEIDL